MFELRSQRRGGLAFLVVGGIQEGNTPNFARDQFLENFLRIIERIRTPKLSIIAPALVRTDPHHGFECKLNHGADEQVASLGPCLVQDRLGDLYIQNRPGKTPTPNVGFHVKPLLSTPRATVRFGKGKL
jgi:hypothetical protein